MFCKKCGKELPDNAQFCSGCGNQIGAAPAAVAAPAQVPVIFKRLIAQIVNFFTKKNPLGVVANSAKDNSFSGLILALFGAIVMSLSTMVNVNQGMLAITKWQYKKYGVKFTSEAAKALAKNYPSAASFFLTLLGVVVTFAAAGFILFAVANYFAKKPLTISGAFNIVSYASIPVICAAILNMLLGLIWITLAPLTMFFAGLFTILLIISAFNKVIDSEKNFTSDVIVVMSIALVAIILGAIVLNGINGVEKANGCIAALFNYWFKG